MGIKRAVFSPPRGILILRGRYHNQQSSSCVLRCSPERLGCQRNFAAANGTIDFPRPHLYFILLIDFPDGILNEAHDTSHGWKAKSLAAAQKVVIHICKIFILHHPKINTRGSSSVVERPLCIMKHAEGQDFDYPVLH